MNFRSFFFLLALAGLHAGAHAQLFKCKGADGQYAFQQVPCAAGTTDANPRPKPAVAEAPAVLPPKDNKPGANWDLGPRALAPSRPPQQAAAPTQPVPTRPTQVSEERRQRKQGDLASQQADEQRKAEEAKAVAFNRMQRCNHARQQLEVAKVGKPIFSRDNKGERHYVKDEDRPATTAAAERRVAEECN